MVLIDDQPQPDRDFGDAPDGFLTPIYPTLSANLGANHTILAGYHLGTAIDPEPDGQPSPLADRDDLDAAVDDEDGVVFSSPMIPGQPATVDIFLTDLPGTIKFYDIEAGVTLKEEVEEVSGLARQVIVQSQDEKKHPQLLVQSSSGKTVRKILLPVHATLMVQDGMEVVQGDVMAKIPRATTKTKDITGGLPRVVDLFEARHPKDPAVMAEVDGQIQYGEIVKGSRKILVNTDDGEEREYSIP